MVREDRYSPTLVYMYTTPIGLGLETNSLDRQRRPKPDQIKVSEPPRQDYLKNRSGLIGAETKFRGQH